MENLQDLPVEKLIVSSAVVLLLGAAQLNLIR